MRISNDKTIELLERIDSPVKRLDIGFNFEDDDYFQLETTFHEKRYEIARFKYTLARFTYTLSDPAEWERLGRAIGLCSSIQELDMRKMKGEIGQIDDFIQEVYQCIGLLYRGLESNTSIKHLKLDMDFFPSSGVFPTLNLNGALFKENLKQLTLSSEVPIRMNQSLMITQLLESTSLDRFDLSDCRIPTKKVYGTRIILACIRVRRLDIKSMNTTEGATALATLLRNRRSIPSQFSVHKNMSAKNLYIILDGLASNSTLKKLDIHVKNTDIEASRFEQLLCNASSIEGIRNSNHTLEELDNLESSHEYMDVTPFVRECLNLNRNTNKDKVIRTKIARYYFRGEFDVSSFVTMNTKLLPRVMAMIEGDAISRRDAIYRLLKNIPDLCTFPSGVSRKRKNNTLYSETHLSIMHPNNTTNQHDHQNYHSIPGRNRNNHRDRPNQKFQGSDGPFYHPLQLGQTYQRSQNVIAHKQHRFLVAPSFCPNQASCQQQFQMQPVAPTIQRQQNLAVATEVQHAVACNSGHNKEQKSTMVQKPKHKLNKFCEKLKKLNEKKANTAKVNIREENESLKEEKRIQKKRTKEMLRQSRAELSKVQEENKKLKEEMNHMNEEVSRANVAQVKVMDKIRKLKEEKKRMANEISEANEQVKKLKEEVSQANVAQAKVTEDENKRLKEEKKRMAEEISEANEQVEKLKATIRTLVS
eukprot:scaffold12375_cov36-Cyclotella_meneghiniana.AAC.1